MSRKERRASLRAEKEKQKQLEESKTHNLSGHPSNASLNRSESLASLGVSIKTVDSDEEYTRDARIALKNISCTIERGSLVAVVGSVGSGKSSFLSAILGEMESIDGSKVYMPPKFGEEHHECLVSYCAQSPWVINDTLRGNILFGRPYDKDRYGEVVAACALLDDLAVLPAGDKTEIGERGINLSGGQKARIALARAMYSQETKLMLLDDPLSAVDSHVGEHLFRHAITGNISMGTTRVLVTHHVHFLPRCDKVIVLEKGEIKHTGSYQELIARGVDFAGAVEVSKKEKCDEIGNETKKEQNDSAKGDKSDHSKTDATKADGDKLKKAGEKLVKDEEQMEGSVEGSMYTHYAKAGGLVAFASVFVIQGVGRASEIMASFWLSIWADATAKSMMTDTPMKQSSLWYLNIYAAFGIGGVGCLTLRALAMAVHRLRASRRLHDSLTQSILRAPVAFFDVTPIGRVLNRFAADMDKIDLELTQSLGQAVSTTFSVLGAVGAIVAATRGTLLVALLPIGYINYV
jgi:ATP-binding cassette subfamily C (CFTR/MRP) protein 1